MIEETILLFGLGTDWACILAVQKGNAGKHGNEERNERPKDCVFYALYLDFGIAHAPQCAVDDGADDLCDCASNGFA